MNLKKTPDLDLVTEKILKEPRRVIMMLTYLINVFRLKYVPSGWKVAEVIMINKPQNPPNDVTSYNIPVINILKLFEKVFLIKNGNRSFKVKIEFRLSV